jgi:hypothetical protein
MIPAVIERCAGIDVGKTFLTVCLLTGPAEGEPKVETRKFGTPHADLEALRRWLFDEHCTRAVMESAGSYWKPVFNILETSMTVILTNGQDVKGRKGHKTDWNDCRWLAHLLRHGLVRASFIPSRPVRELRDLTRRRKQVLSKCHRRTKQKVLEEANVKIGSVLTDVFGVSGQLMLEALLEGKATMEEIANLARHTGRRKIPEIIQSLEGNRLDSHADLAGCAFGVAGLGCEGLKTTAHGIGNQSFPSLCGIVPASTRFLLAHQLLSACPRVGIERLAVHNPAEMSFGMEWAFTRPVGASGILSAVVLDALFGVMLLSLSARLLGSHVRGRPEDRA